MHFADNHAVSYAEYKQFLVDLRTVLEELDIVTDTIFTEYPSVADEAPSDKNVESLRNSLNMAKVAINY
jgi:KaiC/GvpD/RAD55 family RecA-like ATPase